MGLPIPAIHLEHAGASAVVLAKEEAAHEPEYNLIDALKEDRTRHQEFSENSNSMSTAAWE